MKKILVLFLVVTLASLSARSQTKYASAVQFMQQAKSPVPGLESNSSTTRAFDFSPDAAKSLFLSQNDKFILSNFPVGIDESQTLELSQANSVFDGRTHIHLHVNGGFREIAIPVSRSFRGGIQGESGSRVFVVMTGDEMYTFIERANGSLLQVAPSLTKKNTAILQDNTHGVQHAIKCSAENLPEFNKPMEPFNGIELQKSAQLQATDLKEMKLAVETDRYVYKQMGNDENRIAQYVYAVFATVSWIYEREVNVMFTVTDLMIHTDADPDPYKANAKGDIQTLLDEFTSYWSKNWSTIKRTSACLLSGPGQGSSNLVVGGIAHLGGLCNTSVGYAVCGIKSNGSLPAQGYQWDSYVTAHEVGHNFGSPHTHVCSFWGAPLDSCVSSQGSLPVGDACWTGKPIANPGSIMSYCDLVTGTSRYTFLPPVATVIRSGADKSCMTAPVKATIKVTQPIGGADQVVRGDTGVSVEWTSAKVTNVNIEYSTDAGKTFNVISDAINLPATNRFYKWVPPSGINSNTMMIRIYSSGNQAIGDTSYAVFSLGTSSITINFPKGGERLGRKTTENILWDRIFLAKNKIEFSPDGNDPWTTVLPDTSISFCAWNIPDIETNKAKIRITGGSGSTVIAVSDYFSIGTPTISVISPVLNDSACIGKPLTVKWQSDFIRKLEVRYSINNGKTFPGSQSISTGADATVQSYTWTVPNKSSDSAVIRFLNIADGNQFVLSPRFSIKVCAAGVDEQPEMNGLRITRLFPSPATDKVVLTIDNFRQELVAAEYEIIASDGRSILKDQVQLINGEQQIQVPLLNVPAGGYIIILRAKGSELSLPFVVAR